MSRKKAQALFKLCDIGRENRSGHSHTHWLGTTRGHRESLGYCAGVLSGGAGTQALHGKSEGPLSASEISRFLSCRPITFLLRNLPCLANTLKRRPWLLCGASRAEGALDGTRVSQLPFFSTHPREARPAL